MRRVLTLARAVGPAIQGGWGIAQHSIEATRALATLTDSSIIQQLVPSTNSHGKSLDVSHQLALFHQTVRAASTSSNKRAAVSRLKKTTKRASKPTTRTNEVVASENTTALQPEDTRASTTEVAAVVNHPALIVARPIEWGTVLLGYEQANRYTVYDNDGTIVAHLLEDEGSIGRAVGRQILRTRRPFTATVLSPDGEQVIFRLRRPMYLINSSIYIEDGEGNVVGEVHQRWHVWKRYYDLYIDRQQFAAIEGGFLAWDFELKDQSGKTLALIDRNFVGFGKELFTDAGKYAIHFGESPQEAAEHIANTIHAQHPDKPTPPVTKIAQIRNDSLQVIPTSTGNQLVVHRSLRLSERMVALAAAISIDYDFFSRHSRGGGALGGLFYPPIIPYPVGGGEGAAAGAEAAAAEGTDVGTAAAATPADTAGYDDVGGGSGAEPLERDLGGDEWEQPDDDNSGWGGMFGGDDDGGDDEGGGFGGLFDNLRDMWED